MTADNFAPTAHNGRPTRSPDESSWTGCPDNHDDKPTVCINHGRFIPCRKQGDHHYSSNPFWVKSVRDYQTSTIPGLTWEPAGGSVK